MTSPLTARMESTRAAADDDPNDPELERAAMLALVLWSGEFLAGMRTVIEKEDA